MYCDFVFCAAFVFFPGVAFFFFPHFTSFCAQTLFYQVVYQESSFFLKSPPWVVFIFVAVTPGYSVGLLESCIWDFIIIIAVISFFSGRYCFLGQHLSSFVLETESSSVS